MPFPSYKQLDAMDCGPTCIRIIAKYYGKHFPLQILREKCQINRQGVSLLGISHAAEQIGFRTVGVKISLDTLCQEFAYPCIVHWNQKHFVVLYKVSRNKIYVSDPAKGLVTYSKDEFSRYWASINEAGEKVGIALLLEPSQKFYLEEEQKESITFSDIKHYFFRHKKLFFQLILGLFAGMLLQLVTPFLAQSMVDVGIATKDISFIYLLLIGQLMLFVGSTVIDFVRSWIMLHISTRIDISLLSNFLIKLMKLPISYFDTKMTGDIMQRMGDHSRIQSFLTGSSISTFFSLTNFIVFSFIIIAYDVKLFLIFLAGSVLYFGWVLAFLKVRRSLDFKRFNIASKNQSITIQLIQGMQEIKLNNCETQKRWDWERIQAKQFKISVKSLTLSQIQGGGASFINQAKNIFVTFYSAKAVIDGNLTLGGMIAIQYIIGQLNAPVQQFIGFVQSMQDAQISMERINEINGLEDEEPVDRTQMRVLPENRTIEISELCFKYPGYDEAWILDHINLLVPGGKTTAIVGASGSGKTTLLKLLLRFYTVEKGGIKIGESKLYNISPGFWRSRCGVVMQDGYIFSDTIANNIAIGEDYPDWDRLVYAAKMANIEGFIESLPLGFNTKIGAEGSGISQGQKQRILIARSVYKDPDYIFFDEATNSLDANNEKTILENLDTFFKGRTVMVVAHRLSTVKNADQIIVLDKGKIVEKGTHEELTALKKEYYRLVKNQLELGN
ncbi:peptidase domain-containing ABC transporter [Chitinophagaceae bacterium LWZ2-11]